MRDDAVSTIVELACADLPGGHARPHCRKCTSPNGYLARYVHVNGTVAIRWVCDWCEDYKTAPDLPRSILAEVSLIADPIEIAHLPLVKDNTLDSTNYCVVCDERAVEYHHWAPTRIFPHWGHVPGVYLCQHHHDEWHDTMRAHGLRYPHELVAV